jgi:hypothetical protein
VPRLDLSRYLEYEELEPLLQRYAKAYPALTHLTSLGQSRQGRELWVLELHDPATGPAEHKAAMYIDGNVHGNEIQGTEVCLYTIDHVLRHREDDPEVRRVLDQRVLLIAPCTNPDGRVAFLERPSTPHSSRRNLRPVDDDQDGQIDEDGLEDLDGDGEILQMRRRVPAGPLVTHPEDDRLLIPAPPDEPGTWERLGSEGLDNDGDGRLNEDPPGGVDLNRNFPSGWRPERQQHGAGPYPLSEPETRAIVEYLSRWPNLAGVQSYHNAGELILRPPASTSDREARMPREDVAVFDALATRGQELLPGYRYLQTYEGLYHVHGGFLDHGYLGLGVIFFTNELWKLPQDFDGDGHITELERLRWSDRLLGGEAFVPWHPFEHPTLGPIEIGGWRSLTRRIPPAFQLEELCYRNMRFTLFHADSMPLIDIESIEMTHVTERLHHVDVVVVNHGLIPTATTMARRRHLAYDDIATLTAGDAQVIGSGLVTTPTGDTELQPHRPAEVSLGNLRGHGSVRARFVVEGWGPATVRVESQKGGVVERSLSLNAPLRD